MNYIKKLVITAILLINVLNIYSQLSIIQGTVQDSINKQAISYVAVYIKDANNVVVSIAYSDDNGKFKLPFSGITSGTLQAELIGYKKYSKNLTFTAGSEYYEEIFLSPDIEILGEIEIADSAKKVVRKIDRDIHKITEQEIKTSHNIYDILKTLPGVVVDESTNTIRFKGSAPEVLVNNMPADFIYPDLRAIDITQLESVELIDRSSIYGGSGEGGIINVKLKEMEKKEKRFGLYLGSDTDYGVINNVIVPSDNLLNINFNLGKVMIINNLRVNSWYHESKSKGTEEFSINDNHFYRTIEAHEKSSTSNFHLAELLGIVVPIKTGQLLIADQIVYQQYKSSYILNQDTRITSDTSFYNIISQTSENTSNRVRNNFITQFNLNNFHKQDIWFYFALNNVYNPPTYYYSNFFSQTSENNIINNETRHYKGRNITKDWFWYTYLQYKYELSQSSQINLFGMYANYLIPQDKTKLFVNDIEAPQYNEDANAKIQYAKTVIGYSKRIKKFSISLSGGYYFQNIAGNFLRNMNNTDTTININLKWHSIDPSIRFKYILNSTNDLYLGYSYTSKEFNLNNPMSDIKTYIPHYIDKKDPLNWQTGNSKLKLEKYHKVYFQYKYTKDSINFSSELFYSLTNNAIESFLIPIDYDTYLSFPENMAFNERIGADLSLWYQISQRWALSVSAQLYHSRFKNNSFDKIAEIYGVPVEEINSKSYGATANASVRYNLKSKIGTNPNLRFWVNYNTKEINFTGYDSQYVNANIAFKTNFFKSKFYVSFGLENFLSPFIHKKIYYNYSGVIKNTDYSSYYYNMRISLSLGLHLFAGDRGTKDLRL